MSDVNDLLHLLTECASKRDLRLTPLETAEVLWLRDRTLGVSTAKTRTQKVPPQPAVNTVVDTHQDDNGTEEQTPTGVDQNEKAPSIPPPASLDRDADFAPAKPNTSDGAPAARAPIFLDTLPALDDELGFARGLHRLSIKRRLPEKTEVDIEQSVAHTAVAGQATLVFRPLERHTMRLLILVDLGGQLAPWSTSFKRIIELAEMVGSFATVDWRWLDLSDATEARWLPHTAGENEHARDRLPHGGPDQLVLILSDAVGPAVASGALGMLLRQFAPGTFVAWLHPWDRSLWERTQVTRLRMARPRPVPADAKAHIAVAMVPFSVDGLRLLEPWIRGRRSAGLEGFRIPSETPRETAVRARPAVNWAEKAQRVAGTIGPQALSVLALAAAIPNYVDVDLLYALCRWFDIPAERVDIAEAMTSGLLERVPERSTKNDPILRFPSEEARLAVLAFVNRDAAKRVLDELLKHFQPLEARSRANDLQIPVDILVRLSGADGGASSERMSAYSESALGTILQSLHGAEGLEMLKRLQAEEPPRKTTMAPAYRKKLIEVALPLETINREAAREKSIRHGHPSTLHLWWARRPLAAARAVLFGQLVDDPSAWPELFPTEKEQEKERQRIFRIIEDLVPWENSNKEIVLNAARLEIARSWARSHPSPKSQTILKSAPSPATVNDYLATELPPVHDPFAGGGTIPLEAQRLGLRAVASDLNPVAVLINKALIEIPPKFAGRAPVNPVSRQKQGLNIWKGTQGLAQDIRYYGNWMRDEAFKRIGHLYPDVEITKEMTKTRPDLKGLEGHKFTVIAWLWARTVASPDPTLGGVHVPLISSYWLSKKEGKETWIEPVVADDRQSYKFEIRTEAPLWHDAVSMGTKLSGASFKCLLSGSPIEAEYIRSQGQNGKLGTRLLAVVLEGSRSRIYLPPTEAAELLAKSAVPPWVPDANLPEQALGFRVQNYGITQWADLFTARQTAALATFATLVDEVRNIVKECVISLADSSDGRDLVQRGFEPAAYADAVASYLACALSRAADFGATLCVWSPAPKNEVVMHVFGRQTLSMTWDFAEVNFFSESSGNWLGAVEWVAKVVELLPGHGIGTAFQANAMEDGLLNRYGRSSVLSTDPPYYDNVPYADLSDFFYIWLRRGLRNVHKGLTSTLLVPKSDELVAEPARHGGKDGAEKFFLNGMRKAMAAFVADSDGESPAAIYYAYKQTESGADGTSSTGWETFLQALTESGFEVVGTWPMRTERPGRLRDTNSNALASSIVLICRKRSKSAQTITRGDFLRILRQELPSALKALQHSNIAPVDVAQASIGPGMAIFSRHAKVLEPDGSAMTVGAAIHLINRALDECLAEQEGEIDSDTRFAITWYEQHRWNSGSFGEAETLAKARNISVSGIARAGILESVGGKVRLLRRSELLPDWDPSQDERLTVWEAMQHLIKRLEEESEDAAARLLKQIGPLDEKIKALAYRLYNVCLKRSWAEDAQSYNALGSAWSELEKIAAGITVDAPPTGQVDLFGNLISAEKPTKGGKRKGKGKGAT